MSLHLVPRSLQYIEQVAQLGSIQAASREFGISASAIHRQIKSIEDAVGEMLFDRDAKGMTLTPAGGLILDLARDWRLDNARLWTVIQANRGIEQGHIRIAAMDSMVNGFVPEMVGDIARLYPRVQVDIEITNPDGAAKGVLNGDFDIAAVANVAPHDNLKFHWSREFPLGCIATPEHPVASMERISFSEFVSHPVVFQSAALSIRKLLEARHSWIFDRAVSSVTVNSIQLMKLLVLSGRYVAVTSELDAGPEIRSEQLRFVPISDKDRFRQSISLISNTLIPESTASQKIIAMAVQLLERLTGPADFEY
jgi:DNA-binding transcriptional LysR family regulator